MKNSKFKVGDRVTINTNGNYGMVHMPISFSSVEKVHKNYLVLKNGSQWSLDGKQRPRSSNYRVIVIEHTTNEHITLVKTYKLYHKIRKWVDTNLKNCDLDILTKIDAVITGENHEVS